MELRGMSSEFEIVSEFEKLSEKNQKTRESTDSLRRRVVKRGGWREDRQPRTKNDRTKHDEGTHVLSHAFIFSRGASNERK